MGKHAKLAASASSRWMNCPGSVIGSEHVIESGSGSAARLGTAAHFLGEICLREAEAQKVSHLDPHDFIGGEVYMWKDDAVALKFFKNEKAFLYYDIEQDKFTPSKLKKQCEAIPIDDDMAYSVSIYLEECEAARYRLGKPTELEKADDEALNFQPIYKESFEEYFDLTEIHGDLGGSGDFSAFIEFGNAEMIDFKNGVGIVEVDENPQLKTYALGLLLKNPSIEFVRTTIVQPRASHPDGPVRSMTYAAKELLAFGEELKIAAVNTEDPEAPRKAGSWCKFCPILGECPTARAATQKQALVDFADDPEEIAHIPEGATLEQVLAWIPFLDDWIRGVNKFALEQGKKGISIKGYKVVRKRTNRAWIKKKVEKDLLTKMKALKIPNKDCYSQPKLLTPAQMEKLGKNKEQKDKVKKLVKKYVENPIGELTLALESDKREAVDPKQLIQDDFDDEAPQIGN